MRGLKGSNYWVMETTAGPRGGGNASVARQRRYARGNLGRHRPWRRPVSYWQWRDALNGGEANHGAIVDVDGEPDPIYAEYRRWAGSSRRRPALEGTHVQASVAILHSYPSRWDINWQKMNPAYDAIDELMSYYTPLHELGYTIDIVPPDRDLSSTNSSSRRASTFLRSPKRTTSTRYVKAGGILSWPAIRDEGRKQLPVAAAAARPLASLLGARVEQFTALDTGRVQAMGRIERPTLRRAAHAAGQRCQGADAVSRAPLMAGWPAGRGHPQW